jgi:hypothetical protein
VKIDASLSLRHGGLNAVQTEEHVTALFILFVAFNFVIKFYKILPHVG